MTTTPAHVSWTFDPVPFLEWQSLLELMTVDTADLNTLRSWRRRSRVSDGVRVTVRRDGRASGSQTYFSVLTFLANAVRTQGDVDASAMLLEAATRVERTHGDDLKSFLAASSLADLPSAAFYPELLAEQARALSSIDWPRYVVDAGAIVELTADRSYIKAQDSPASELIDLPRTVTDAWGLRSGDFVFLIRRERGGAILLQLVPSARNGTSDTELRAFDSATWAPMRPGDFERVKSFASSHPDAVKRLRPAG